MDEHATFLKAIIAQPDRDLPRLIYADWLEENPKSSCVVCLGSGKEPWSCKVCEAEPDPDGEVRHGKGCYVLDSDGGGYEWIERDPCSRCHGTGEVGNGHAERAEFIRVQCELARLNDDSVMCHHPDAKPGDWYNDSDCLKCGRAAAIRRRERELWAAHGKTWFGTEFTAAGWVTLEDVRRGFMESVEMPWSDFRTHAHAIMAATPLRKVRLTTWSDDIMGELSAARFSGIEGIEFELPRRAVVLTA
jgi:uncharacterized protein (TIGR02996 family)